MERESNDPRTAGARKRGTPIAIALGVSFLVLVGAALATPGIGVISAPVHARGTFVDRVNVHSQAAPGLWVQLRTKGAIDLATQQLVIAGGGSTGWHSHPGPVLVTVKSGALRVIYASERSCQGTLYEAGDTFVDRGSETVHIARNESMVENVELWATYFVPGAPSTAFRIDAPDPGTC